MQKTNWCDLSKYYDYFLNIGFTIKDAQIEASYAQINFGNKANILVLGCATGRTLEPFFAANLKVIGVDASFEMISKCPDHIRHALHVADARELPFPRSQFDLVVIATGILDAMDDNDAFLLLKEVTRVCRPSGHISIYTHKFPNFPLIHNLLFIKDSYYYYRRYIMLCKFIQNNFALKRLIKLLLAFHIIHKDFFILNEPVGLRRYFNNRNEEFNWNLVAPFITSRIRLWSRRSIALLAFKFELKPISLLACHDHTIRTILVKSSFIPIL